MKVSSFTVGDGGQRLDVFLTESLPEYSRSRLQSMIKEGEITVNGRTVKAGFKLSAGDQIMLQHREVVPMEAAAQDIGLDIIYEDKDIIVINKPQGMVVHPAAGHYDGTLVNALLHHCGDLSGVGGVIRPGIVHRIDKDTSGLLVAAKNDAAHIGLSAQWKVHSIKRVYHAILHGMIAENCGDIDAPIGRHPRDRKKMAVEPKNGKPAITHYRVLERLPFAQCTYTQLELETGRTHQIRVHMSHLGYPVVGDPLYGPKKSPYLKRLNGQALHAKVLGFEHPITGKYLEFDSDLPDYFRELLAEMRSPQL